MVKKIVFPTIILIATLFFIFRCEGENIVRIKSGDRILNVNVEIADDNEKRSQGLMFRENLGKNEGMLFMYDRLAPRTFWMKDTLIPLDIIFISEKLEIVKIQNAVPCKADPCPFYPSQAPALYALEVNGGYAAENNLKPGDTISFEFPCK